MPSEDALIARIHADASRLAQAVADAEFWHGRYLQQIEAEAKSRIAEIERRHRQTLAEAKAAYEAELAKAAAAVRAISDSCGIVAAEWDDPVWRSWAAAAGGALPEALRLGRLRAPGARPLEMPALLFASGRPNAMLTCSGPAKLTATAGVQALAARYVATFPPGKLRFTFIDPVGLGQNAAAFMHLADYDDALVTGKAWTEPQHIEQRLANLTEHMENVIQKYLRNQYGTIEEYNRQAGEIAEPYRVLAVFDFPTNFGEASARRLVSIAQNGPRCGVYTLVVVDSAKPLPYGFSLDELAREATVIAWNGQRFVWLDDDLSACELILDTPPPAPLLNRIIEAVGEAAKQASNVEVPFQRVARPPEEWWTNSSLDGVRAALGPSGARSLQYLDLGQATAQHVLVAGRTGSGKTTLLHTLITNLAVTYGPEEVELYLIDFKEGVAFKTYATHQLPHARVVAIESEREFGLSVLQGLNAELARRGVVFRASAVEALNDHRRSTGEKLPRILLIVDEFQRFFTEDDHIASEARQILDQLVRQGRGFGIHVLLGSQTLAGTYTLLRSTIEQMAVRIALQCSEADSRLILADDNPAARLLSRPGEAIYNAKNGLVEGNSRFQVAWLGDEERDAYLRQVLALAEKRGYRPPRAQIVFEGNAPARVESNAALAELLASWPSAGERRDRAALAYLGDPVAIKEPTAAVFRRQSGSNLLIVGQDQDAAWGMMAVSLVSLAAQTPCQTAGSSEQRGARFYVLDFSATDTTEANLLLGLAEGLPHPVSFGRRRQLPGIIGDLAAEVQRRIENEGAAGEPIYLLLYALQRARDLRPEEEFSYSPSGEEQAAPRLSDQFATILREGPDLGVHSLVWCDTLNNLNRSLDRRSLREFELRVALQMSVEDSANLIETPAAGKLGDHRALLYVEAEGRLEKFRPYGAPTEAWLRRALEQLRRA